MFPVQMCFSRNLLKSTHISNIVIVFFFFFSVEKVIVFTTVGFKNIPQARNQIALNVTNKLDILL